MQWKYSLHKIKAWVCRIKIMHHILNLQLKTKNCYNSIHIVVFLKHMVCSFSFSVNPYCPALNVNWEGFSLLSSRFESKVQSGRGCVWHEVSVFEDLRRAFIVIEDLLQARNTCWLIVKCFSLSPPSSSLLRRQIVNPHRGASYGRAPGPYFRGQIHHVWCGWCSHNSSLTAVMFSGIIQRSINTRAWRKYNAFIKTVNRKYFLQKPEEKRITGFPEVSIIILLMPSDDDKTNANRNNSRKLMYWNIKNMFFSFFNVRFIFSPFLM